MTATNTNWLEVGTNQNAKEPVINTQRGRLDAALTELYEVVGDVSPTLTESEFSDLICIRTDGTQTAQQTVTIPSTVKRMFIVENLASFDLVILEGSTQFTLGSMDTAVFYTSGTTDSVQKLFGVIGTVETLPLRPQFQWADTGSQTVYQRVFADTQTMESIANGLVARMYVDTPPDGTTNFDIRKNGSQVGTVQVLSGANTGTYTVASDVSFIAGDRLSIVVTTANSVGKNYTMSIELI